MSTLASLLVLLLLAAPHIAAQGVSARNHADVGITLAREGKLAEAEKELEAALRIAPRMASYHAQLASILGLQQKWKLALESFQRAVNLAPENLDFRRETAAVQWQLGLMASAERNLQFVLAKQPNDSGALLLLGLVKDRTGEYAQAAQLLDSQFELVSQHQDRMVAFCHSSLESGENDKIARILFFLKQMASTSQWMQAIERCTEMAAMAGNLQAAEELFSQIPNDNPARPPAGLRLAKLRYDQGQVSEAKELLSQLAGQGLVSADLQDLLGNCLEAEREPDLALQAYERAVQIDASRIDYYEDLVSLLLLLHRTQGALAVVNRALTVAPTDARPWVWRGNVELRRNSAKDAMESYQHAAKLDSSNADATLGIATVYFATGRSDEAIAEYKAGIARFPGDARFYVACAEMLLGSPDSLKLQEQAGGLLRKAIKLAPQSAEAHYLLGQLALQQDRLQDALDELTRSVQSDPDRSKPHFALAGVYRRMERPQDAAKEFALYQKLKQSEETALPSMMGTREP